MGKTTLYHPVSLHVLRGAAEYCGWRFARIKQTSSEPTEKWARYKAEIQSIPARSKNQNIMIMQNDLAQCFMTDVEVHWLRQTKKGIWIVDIVTHEPLEEGRNE